MTDSWRRLRIPLLLTGILFTLLLAAYPLSADDPGAQMIIGIYGTLGIFLLIASRNPVAHASLIRFTVWSSVAHGGVMASQNLGAKHMSDPYAWVGVIVLWIIAAMLGMLTPRGSRPQQS